MSIMNARGTYSSKGSLISLNVPGNSPFRINSVLAISRMMNDQNMMKWMIPTGLARTRFWAKANFSISPTRAPILSKRSSGWPSEIRLSRFQQPQANTAREAIRRGVKMSGLGVICTSERHIIHERHENHEKKIYNQYQKVLELILTIVRVVRVFRGQVCCSCMIV